MTQLPSLELTASENGQTYAPISVPSVTTAPSTGLRSDLVKVEENTQLHIAVMHAHEDKAEVFIDVNMGIANKSTEAFGDYARSSEARVLEARGCMFEKDIQLVEHHFRQSFFEGLSANARDAARQTGRLAAMSVLPVRQEPAKKGFWARVFGV